MSKCKSKNKGTWCRSDQFTFALGTILLSANGTDSKGTFVPKAR